MNKLFKSTFKQNAKFWVTINLISRIIQVGFPCYLTSVLHLENIPEFLSLKWAFKIFLGNKFETKEI